MISFHGQQEIKDSVISELLKHKELDNLKQGAYFNEEKQKGCAVTCTMFTSEDFKNGCKSVDTYDIHGRYESKLGIPRILAKLEDRIFEGLSVSESDQWPLDFMSAIPVGGNLENAWRKLMIWILTDSENGAIKYAKTADSKKAIQDVSKAFNDSLTKTVEKSKWIELRNYAAYAADAYAAAYASYAADAAKKNYYSLMASKLIEILKETV